MAALAALFAFSAFLAATSSLLLLLALLDGRETGSAAGLGAHGPALLDDLEGGTNDGTLGLDGAAGALLGSFLLRLSASGFPEMDIVARKEPPSLHVLARSFVPCVNGFGVFDAELLGMGSYLSDTLAVLSAVEDSPGDAARVLALEEEGFALAVLESEGLAVATDIDLTLYYHNAVSSTLDKFERPWEKSTLRMCDGHSRPHTGRCDRLQSRRSHFLRDPDRRTTATTDSECASINRQVRTFPG